ncbi:MAG: Na+/H+ antiporter subunit E [Wolbachia sp.]
MNLRQKIKFFSLSFIILFFLWIVLSGYFETFFVFCGVFSSILTLFIFKRLIDAENAFIQILNGTSRLLFYKFLISYIPWLIYQVILSSIYVSKKVLQIELKLEPITILKKCKGHNDESITLFANSVTITPGTLTINIIRKRQTYLSIIYLIDKSLERGVLEIENRVLETMHSIRDNCLK